jgi:hypothetical protein
VALHEVTDVLIWAMRIAPYCPGGMEIEVVIDLPAFFVTIDFVVTCNHS